MKSIYLALTLILTLPLSTFAQVTSSQGMTVDNLVPAPLSISSEAARSLYEALNVTPTQSTSYHVTKHEKSLYLKSGGTSPNAVISVIKTDTGSGIYAVYVSINARLLSFHPAQATYQGKTFDKYETSGSGINKIVTLLNADQGDAKELPFLQVNFPDFEFNSNRIFILEGKDSVLGLSCYSGISRFTYGGEVDLPPQDQSNCRLSFLTRR